MVHQPSGSPGRAKITVFKVTGETNTDDLSPAPDAFIPPGHPAARHGHAEKTTRWHHPEQAVVGPVKFLEDLRARATLVAYVGDVVGTGLAQIRHQLGAVVHWRRHPNVPNKRFGGVCLGGKTPRSSSTPWKTPARCRLKSTVQMDMGDEVELHIDPYRQSHRHQNGAVIAETTLKTPVILDEVRRRPYSAIIGRGLTAKGPAKPRPGPRPPCSVCRKTRPTRQGFAGAKDGWPRLWSAGRPGRPPGRLLRTEDDHRRLARTPPAR